jgi:hypothetical protein
MQLLAITSAFLITWVFSASGFAGEKGTHLIRGSKEGVSFQSQLARRLASAKEQVKLYRIKGHKKVSPKKRKARGPASIADSSNTLPLSVDEAAYVANAEQTLAKMDPQKAKKLGALILTMANDTLTHPGWSGDSQTALNKYTNYSRNRFQLT